MMHGACQKIQQQGVGSREKMTTGSSRGSRFAIVFVLSLGEWKTVPDFDNLVIL